MTTQAQRRARFVRNPRRAETIHRVTAMNRMWGAMLRNCKFLDSDTVVMFGDISGAPFVRKQLSI